MGSTDTETGFVNDCKTPTEKLVVKRGFGSFHSSNLKDQIADAELKSYEPPDYLVKPPQFEEYSIKSFNFGHNAKSKHFYLEKKFTYINHGAFGGALKEALIYSHEWQKYVERQPARFYDRILFPQIVHVQKRLAGFIGCDVSDVVMTSNATTATNAVLRSLDLNKESTIYFLNVTYGAVKNTIKSVSQRSGARMQEERLTFPITGEEEILELVARTLHERTTIAIFDHIPSNYAFIMPLKEIIELCHARGVPVLVDGAHSLGAVPLNLRSLNADYYTSNAHKWFCTTKGCAFLYVKKVLQPTIHGLTVSTGYEAGFHSEFLWTGAKDYCAYLSLHAVLNFWERIGAETIMQYGHKLLVEAADLLQQKWNGELLAPMEMHGMMCCISLPPSLYIGKSDLSYSDGESIQNRLYHEYSIEVPIKCIEEKLYARISAHMYNEISDYETLANAVLEIANL